MGNGCCKPNDRDIPEGIDPCCSVRGRRCLCLPYDDGWAISAQILAIIAVFFSWIWWVCFFFSLVGMALFQITWCTRIASSPFYAYASIAALVSALNLGVAIWAFVYLRTKTDCYPFALVFWGDKTQYENNWDDYVPTDYCDEEVWGAIALVCAVLWGVASACLFHFVKSGRYAKWEEKHNPSEEAPAVELEEGQQEPVVADAAVLETTKNESE